MARLEDGLPLAVVEQRHAEHHHVQIRLARWRSADGHLYRRSRLHEELHEVKVAVTETINCAHQLPGTKLHGHTYRITATLNSTTGYDAGWTFDRIRGRLLNVLLAID